MITNLQTGMMFFSISRVIKEYSICIAVIGWIACALLMVSMLASQSPMYLIFPSSTSFLSSPIYYSKRQDSEKTKYTKHWTLKLIFLVTRNKQNKLHRTNSFLNWYWCIYTVLIIKINIVDIKPHKTSLTTLPNIFRSAFDSRLCSSHQNTKLCCQLNFFPRKLL